MKKLNDLQPDFSAVADDLPQTPFTLSLQLYGLFDRETARSILQAFQQLGLPAPEQHNEFMHGTEGRLVFLNDYGLVIRLEENKSRINDSPWVLPPIASIQAGNAVIEICPGVHFEPDERDRNALCELMLQDGVKFWDPGMKNMGRLPVKTPHFPEGIPVVADRPSAYKLPEGKEKQEAQLRANDEDQAKRREAAAAQEKLYAPLQQLFRECWPEPRNMERFWKECARYVREGKLVAGWNETEDMDVNEGKSYDAGTFAHHYAAKLKVKRESLSSGAPAVRRLLHRSI